MRRQAAVKTYESTQLNQVLEETLHPGGLNLTKRMAEAADLDREQKILDVGCGRGTSLLFFTRHYGCTGMGVDLSPVSIAVAVKRRAEEGVADRVRFAAGGANKLPCVDNEFDVVFSECTLSLANNKAEVIREMARVVRPGGRIVITDIALKHALSDAFKRELGFVCCFSEALTLDGYQTLALNAGLKSLLVEDHSIALKQTAFKVSQGYGSLDEFWTRFGQGRLPCCSPGAVLVSSGVGWKDLFRRGRPGYWLLAWEKPGS
jgi:hypothetical protein